MDRTDCYRGGRCAYGSVELAWVKIGFVVVDLAKRWVDEVRVRANYSIGFRRRGQYCYVLCLSQIVPTPVLYCCQWYNSCEGYFA